MRRYSLALAIILAAGAGPSFAGIMTEPKIGRFPIMVEGRKFIVAPSKRNDTLLLQGAITGNPLAADLPLPVWRKVAETFVEPAGCGVSEVKAVMSGGATWMATYVCPADVDLRELMKSQKSSLKDGLPIEPAKVTPSE